MTQLNLFTPQLSSSNSKQPNSHLLHSPISAQTLYSEGKNKKRIKKILIKKNLILNVHSVFNFSSEVFFFLMQKTVTDGET